MELWDYQFQGENKILEWAKEIRLGKRDRALLDQKLDSLQALRFELASHTHLLAGPLNNSKDKHIYKIRVNASIMIRILVCRGPLANENGITLLAGATERNNRIEPARAISDASVRRAQVAKDPGSYRRRHERFI